MQLHIFMLAGMCQGGVEHLCLHLVLYRASVNAGWLLHSSQVSRGGGYFGSHALKRT